MEGISISESVKVWGFDFEGQGLKYDSHLEVTLERYEICVITLRPPRKCKNQVSSAYTSSVTPKIAEATLLTQRGTYLRDVAPLPMKSNLITIQF